VWKIDARETGTGHVLTTLVGLVPWKKKPINPFPMNELSMGKKKKTKRQWHLYLVV